MSNSFRVGDAVVTRIDELRWHDGDPHQLYPDLDAAALPEHGAVLPPGSFDPATGRLSMSIHGWLVRLPNRTLLIDTCTGNDKELPNMPMFHRLQTPFLRRLRAEGVSPEQVDLVLLTHLHADHVGWNTWLDAGGWRPTFPNARHLFSEVERRYNEALNGGDPAPDLPPRSLGNADHPPLAGVYRQSVRPVIEAELADPVAVDGAEAADGLFFQSTPGHSVDHATIRLRSAGEEALFLGDVLHHPLQVYRPDLRSVYCEFPVIARQSRLAVLEQAADSGALCFSSHFAESSAGRVERRGERFSWRFAS